MKKSQRRLLKQVKSLEAETPILIAFEMDEEPEPARFDKFESGMVHFSVVGQNLDGDPPMPTAVAWSADELWYLEVLE